MEMEHAKILKREMETAITEALQKFEKVTGLEISGIELITDRTMDGGVTIVQTKVETRLR